MKIPKQANAQNIFARTHPTVLFYSTYFRMNYLSKPIAGFIN